MKTMQESIPSLPITLVVVRYEGTYIAQDLYAFQVLKFTDFPDFSMTSSEILLTFHGYIFTTSQLVPHIRK